VQPLRYLEKLSRSRSRLVEAEGGHKRKRLADGLERAEWRFRHISCAFQLKQAQAEVTVLFRGFRREHFDASAVRALKARCLVKEFAAARDHRCAAVRARNGNANRHRRVHVDDA
jgi:hypothetical protein